MVLIRVIGYLSQPKFRVQGCEISYMISENTRKRLERFNDVSAVYSDNKLIHEFFEQQAADNSENTALLFEDAKMTYGELNNRANKLAGYLRSKGIRADHVVGLMVERSFEMLIGIFAVLKAGGAYLPLDPKIPDERLNYYVEDCHVSLILTTEFYMEKVPEVSKIRIEKEEEFRSFSNQNPVKITNSAQLAYVIYTSGSTGKPKGVMIPHKALVNRLEWMQKQYGLTEEDVLLQKTTFSFDVSVWELLWWSMMGAKLAILPPKKEKNPRAIAKAIALYKVTQIHFVPSMLEFFLGYISEKYDLSQIKSLKNVIVSGEELAVKTAVHFNGLLFKKYGIVLWNLYGPTEAAIDVTAYDCSEISINTERIPIGKPIDNISLYVLDDNMEQVEIGVKGELYIGGVGVARGYMNNEELTKEKFLQNPFCSEGRMYRTGDLACWNNEGGIEFYGRADNQIKLRGLRIELEEIEAHLMRHERIEKTAVLVNDTNEENKYLVAFYQAHDIIDENELSGLLLKRLPDYMVPSRYIRIEKFPVNQNGKLDRKELMKYLRGVKD